MARNYLLRLCLLSAVFAPLAWPRSALDARCAYAAVAVARAGHPDHAYALSMSDDIGRPVRTFHADFIDAYPVSGDGESDPWFSPPPALALYWPAMMLPWPVAAVLLRWGLAVAVARYLPRRLDRWWIIAGPMLVFSVYVAQPAALLYVLARAGTARRERELGLWVAVVGACKLWPLVLIPLLLWHRRWLAAAWACLGVAILVAVSGLYAGPEAWRAALHALAFDPHLLSPLAVPFRARALVALLALIIARGWTGAVIAAVATAPVAWPAYACALYGTRAPRWTWAAAALFYVGLARYLGT